MLVTAQKCKKNNKVYYSLIVNNSFVKACKNGNFIRINLSEDFLIGLENKKGIPLKELSFKDIEVKEVR